MKRVFLLGDPVAHSISPGMHNAAFRALGLDWEYQLLPTPVELLPHAVERLRDDDCAGANVTIPHKVAILAHLDAISDRARRLGAANTIVKRRGALIGDNTDTEGFLRPLIDSGIDLVGARTVILGAGGAARAVAFALADSGVSSIVLINRTASRARALSEDISRYFRVHITVGDLAQINRAQLIVNATSVGMAPLAHASPLPPGANIPAGAVAYDLVYRPRHTLFLQQAERAGARTIDGLGMLVRQGAASLELWTGATAPVETMLNAAGQALLADHAEDNEWTDCDS